MRHLSTITAKTPIPTTNRRKTKIYKRPKSWFFSKVIKSLNRRFKMGRGDNRQSAKMKRKVGKKKKKLRLKKRVEEAKKKK